MRLVELVMSYSELLAQVSDILNGETVERGNNRLPTRDQLPALEFGGRTAAFCCPKERRQRAARAASLGRLSDRRLVCRSVRYYLFLAVLMMLSSEL